MPELINIGIAEMNVGTPPQVLRTILGSCVAICLYDSTENLNGLSHIMLPKRNNPSSPPGKYADTAIPLLVDMMKEQGAKKIVAKLVGGATMFKMADESLMSKIGDNNVGKCREILGELGIDIISEDVGGDMGRTLDFYSDNGRVVIRTMNRQELII